MISITHKSEELHRLLVMTQNCLWTRTWARELGLAQNIEEFEESTERAYLGALALTLLELDRVIAQAKRYLATAHPDRVGHWNQDIALLEKARAEVLKEYEARRPQ